jgi:hypothetical protein
MNSIFKIWVAGLVVFFSMVCVSFSAPLVKVDGRQLVTDFEKNGTYEHFFVKGVGYSPTPIGRAGMQWGTTNILDDEAILRRDFQLLYDMHANAIRIWKANNTNNAANEFPSFLTDKTLTIADEYGLKVIPGFWIEFSGWWECQGGTRVFHWDQGFFDLQAKTVRASIRTDILNRWQNFIQQFKGRPEVLFWVIGNENNLQLGDDEQLVRAFYALVDEMAQIAHSIDPDHPVAFVNGDTSLMVADGSGGMKNIFADNLAPHLDIWGVNLYRGETFGDFFQEYAALSQKPLWISEFGIDAWHSVIDDPEGGYEDQEIQAQWVGGLWDEIVGNYEITIGGTVMAYADEWWKPYQWLCQVPGWQQWWRPWWELTDGTTYSCGVFNNSHDLYGIPPTDTDCDGEKDWFPPVPDKFFNEEWWGMMSVQRSLTDGEPDVMTPRLVYSTLQEKFLRGLYNPAAVTAISPDNGVTGDIIVIQGINFGNYKADADFDPACDMNQDGIVNNIDMQILMASYGLTAGKSGFNPVTDINRDGKVDSDDFIVFVSSYGKSAGNTYVTFFPSSTASARIISWSDTEIHCEVPVAAGSGSVAVHTLYGISQSGLFTVRQTGPAITVSPRQGSSGDYLTVTGSRFGTFDGTPNYNAEADFNDDGIVNMIDYSVLSGQWGKTGPDLSADLNRDQVVDNQDLSIFNAAWLGQRGTSYNGTLNYNPEADFNHDGIVNMVDYSVLSGQWGKTGPGLTADLNHDQIVNNQDLVIFNASWLGKRGDVYFQFASGLIARVISWQDTATVIAVPYGAQTGPITLVTPNRRIDAGEFVVNALVINSLSVASAFPGSLIEISGAGFGAYHSVGNYNP